MYHLAGFFDNRFNMIFKIELTIDLKAKQFFAIPVLFSVFTYFDSSWPISIH